MSAAGLSAGVLAVLGCSAANNLVKAASRRLLLTTGVAGTTEATGIVVLAVVASVDATVVADVVAVVAGTATVLVATGVAAAVVVDAVELAAGAPSVWAS